MPRRLIEETTQVRIYEVTNERGVVIGKDVESIVGDAAPTPEARRIDRLEAQIAALKAVPEIASRVNLDAIEGAGKAPSAERVGR